ncbi:MAG: valine--tRNA ligase [Opitutales bacterium]
MPELSKTYDPARVENRWYQAWLDAGCFQARPDPEKAPYAIMIPPPNVTGILHMGHLLNNTYQDIFIRRARQRGHSVLWMPGTDHAGIATQSRVERKLKEQGTSRHEIGREAFVKEAEAWRDQHRNSILNQLRKLGCSLDWDRTAHTLDPDYSQAVLTAFVQLYHRGYIYRGKRMVNWCPVSLTALSDEEVVMKPQQGHLWHVRYERVDEPGEYLEVATTRPETIMGDTAVAVNPKDKRYKQLIGKQVYRPFPREPIPVIADEAVDPAFGTGALKVTPAHDTVDFEIGQRHDLPVIDVFTPEGAISEAAREFVGMDRFEARKAAAARLEETGLLIRAEPYENNVGFSERADVPIEPRLSEQWFARYPKVEEAIRAVREGIIRIYPRRWEKTYLHWLENIQDWCVSRQLWWGHRIPVWYRKDTDRDDPANRHVSVDGPPDPQNWEQDPDVLDTWASSWLWPFATLGWPDFKAEKERGLDYFYPTSVLVTGFDIIFLWVARMIMAGLEFMGPREEEAGTGRPEKKTLTDEEIRERIPFHDVYFTGLVRDIRGRKMSKSLGNSPDPLELLEKYGADGTRLSLVSIAPQGGDIRFDESRIELGRNFCNKLWNVARFRQMSGATGDNSSREAILQRIDARALDADDHAILGRFRQMLEDLERDFGRYELNNATQTIYSFFWNDYCDWYVEVSKTKVQDPATRDNCLALQDFLLRETLLILHPFIPFITEELYHELGYALEGTFIQDTPALTPEAFEELFDIRQEAVEEIGRLRETVSRVRALKAEYNLAARRDVSLVYESGKPEAALLQAHMNKFKRIAGAERVDPVGEGGAPAGSPASVTPLGTFHLDLAGSIDVEAERKRLTQEKAKLDKLVKAGEARLSNEKFLANAPDDIVRGAREQLEATRAKRDEIERLLAGLEA